MEKNGKLTLPVFMASTVLKLLAFLASLFGAYPQRVLGQRNTLLIGQCIIVISLFSVSLFNILDYGNAMFIAMNVLVCVF
jgi:hypothetical protein